MKLATSQRHVSRKGNRMSTTTWQEVYRDSPRIKEIEAVFAFIANPNVTVDQIWAGPTKL